MYIWCDILIEKLLFLSSLDQ